MTLWDSLRILGHHDIPDPALDEAVARAVKLVEPKLEYLAGYPNRYRAAVRMALDYATRLAAQVPGPLAAEPASFVGNPHLRAFFASPEHLEEALVRSRAIHDLEALQDAAGPHFYALLGVRRREKTVLDMEVQAGQLRRDVARRVVSFADHTVTCPAATEADARQRLAWSFFDSLMARIYEEREQWRSEIIALDRILDEIRFRLRTAEGEARDELLHDQKAVEADKAALAQQRDLSRAHQHIDHVLANPEQYLRLEPFTYRMDALGILRADGSVSAAKDLEFHELVGRDRRIWTVALMRFSLPRDGGFRARLEQASRWLTI